MKDKATVEMECMEEGYLAKIMRGDGAKEIKVGEVFISSSCKPASSITLLSCTLLFGEGFPLLFHKVQMRKENLFLLCTANFIVK